ncbi:MAG: alpha/beta hydrolase [Myxococcota bacterium]|nr:alpha/beta hydrolase [Myxococcota bacterium]
MQERFIKVNGLSICLCTWGAPKAPLLLLLHGFLDQGAAWKVVAEELASQGFRVVAPDARGHGRSGHIGVGGTYHFTDYLVDLEGILAHLGEPPAGLIGHSMGGTVAALYAGVRPECAQSLVVVEGLGPVGDNHDTAIQRLKTHLNQLQTPPKHPVYENVEAAAKRLARFTPDIDPDLAMILAMRSTVAVEGGVQWSWDPLHRARFAMPFLLDRFMDAIGQIQIPTTLIYGDSSWYQSENLPDRESALPQLVARKVLKGGHALHHDAPQALAEIIA